MAIGLNSPLIINGQEVYPQVTPKNVKGLIDFIYPVGSIYMSVNDTNPHDLFGGTWEQIKDRFLLACGSNYSAGTTGGEATHKLTVNEMPSHNHTAVSTSGENGSVSLYPFTMVEKNSNIVDINVIRPAGGNQAHNNMPPYLVVYMWQRTA